MNAPHHPSLSEAATLGAFADAIRAAGLTPPEAIEADGAIHRFSSSGKRGDESGWYVLHLDGVPAGSFGCWRAGLLSTWCAKATNEMTQAEQAAHRQKVEAMRTARKADQEQRQQQAREQAAQRWEAAAPAQDYPYLKRKGIQAHGTRVEGDRLLIPMHLTEGGTLQSLQVIDFAGGKRFLPGGRVKGCFCLLGEREEIEDGAELVICEGFATGASIREATGYPVAVAFNAGNLEAVALALRAKYPGARLILAADDDWRTEGNPGLDKATEAARAVGAWLAVPRFPEDCRPDVATDFNDLHKLAGLEAVRERFTAALATEAVTPAPAIQIPGEHERPAYLVLDDWHEHDGTRYAPGVWYFGIKPGRGDAPPSLTQQRICGPLHIEAVTTDTSDGNYGRLLRFKTTTGRWKSWAMPMAMLKGDGSDLRGELLSMGLDIAHRGREQLTAYLQHRAPERVIQCATQTGWAGPERQAFVLPDAVIGPQADGVTYQSDHAGGDEYTTRGTLAGWQAGTAALAVGNPMLVLALCTAFAGPVLALVGADSGGINTIGASSKGKSSMLFAACSVWGGPSYRRNWRATGNGLESVAALFNDSLLALDEISQCDPREVGETVYMLGNGQGKTRAARTGGARSVARWRVSILSNGERSIVATMEEGGFRTKAGQAVRIIDLPVTDQAHGAWDRLHQYPSGAALSDALRREAETHYGHAGRAFLERLTRDDHDQVRELLASIKARPEFNAEGGEGQFQRVAARFAVLALAGELATAYGVTGWQRGEAIRATAVALRLWLGMQDGRTTDAEGPQVVDQVTEFIDRHGDSRFSDADADPLHSPPVRERAGWWRDRDGERVYLFTGQGLKDALKGHDFKRALDHLEQAGMLKTRNKTERIRAIGGTTKKFYTIKPTDAGDAK
ncbi:DUF927 domain-containing protein [Malikia spinosa]|uniref:DUF927 domain-containing protein n=1 Tax=Malikia spinosa TaxID=86180 RepID=UPI00192554B1|nr:DUF927 domain-containing protein [Malikia spinosa]